MKIASEKYISVNATVYQLAYYNDHQTNYSRMKQKLTLYLGLQKTVELIRS